MARLEHLIVGIFSREDLSTYEWLIGTVTSTRGVKDVRPVPITNKWDDFEKHIPKCSTAILYHSRTRGRLNITDVTDSLYDKELKALNEAYGRDNVIVVVGDLQDSSDERKASILEQQPSIGRYAKDLFLFNDIKSDQDPFQGEKEKELKTCIEKMGLKVRRNLPKGNAENSICRDIARRQFCKNSFIWMVFLTVALLIVIIIVSVRASHHLENPSTSPPPPNVTNVSSNFIPHITPTPLSTIANITSSFISHMKNATTQLPGNATTKFP